MEITKRFALVLHAHLPHVLNHGRWPHGSDWLSEVASETYLPLLSAIAQLMSEGIKPRITLGLTPILCEQLSSDAFKEEFPRFIETRHAAALKDKQDFLESNADRHLTPVAEMWASFYNNALEQFRELNFDIVGTFKRLQDHGVIEIITSAATHGYLPLLYNDDRVREQIRVGVETYRRHFNTDPSGFWLPECAYRPAGKWQRPFSDGGEVDRAGIESLLAEYGIKYFIVDSHLVTHGTPLGAYKQLINTDEEIVVPAEKTSGAPTHKSYLVGMGPAACFVRDAACGMQVWSGEHGYPGDPAYLEFHKRRWPGGLRYWRVTSSDKDLGSKAPYDPEMVSKMASKQAWHFVGLVKWALREGGIVCAPYDAELFGHWWHEGLEWMKECYRLLAVDDELKPVTLSEALVDNPAEECIELPAGSWGAGGSDEVWQNPETDLIWETLYSLAERLNRVLANHTHGASRELDTLWGVIRRQMLLAESSDWPFLITTGHVKDYAERRFSEHASNVAHLLDIYESISEGNPAGIEERAEVDSLSRDDFPFIGLL
jgi:1,4-alpha-glucan branching enzyme